MNSWQLFIASFTKPQKLNAGKTSNFGKVILYTLFLSIILCIPISKHIYSLLNSVRTDGQKISEKLPAFSIKDGQIDTQSKNSGFIYQTNSIIFTFDPEGKRTVEDVERDSVADITAIALLKDRLVIALPKNGVTDSLFSSNTLNILYTNNQLNTLTDKTLKSSLALNNFPLPALLVFAGMLIYSIFINFVIDVLVLTIGATLYSKIKLTRLTLFQNVKIIVYCSTAPVFITSLLQLVIPSAQTGTLLMLLTLLIYFQAIKQEPRIQIRFK